MPARQHRLVASPTTTAPDSLERDNFPSHFFDLARKTIANVEACRQLESTLQADSGINLLRHTLQLTKATEQLITALQDRGLSEIAQQVKCELHQLQQRVDTNSDFKASYLAVQHFHQSLQELADDLPTPLAAAAKN